MAKRQRPYAYDRSQNAKKRRMSRPSGYYAAKTGGVYRTQPQLSYKARVASINRQVAGQEAKYIDTAFSTDATTTETIVALSTVAAGSTNLTRDGNKVAWKTINLRMAVNNEALAQNCRIRIMIIHDAQSNAVALPAIAAYVLDAASMQSQHAISFQGRFTTLMDKVYTVNSTTSTAGALQKTFIKKYIKIPPGIQMAQYVDGTSSVPASGSLTLCYFSDVATGASDMDVQGTIRVKFIG